tara:strand:+ start:168 stop:317 length:150 start_codon:yes stop_codon:yes gene_type:complete
MRDESRQAVSVSSSRQPNLVPTWLDLDNNDKQAAARIATPYSSYTFPIR